MLSSDARKLLDFAKQAEGLAGEAFIEFCVANNVAVLKDPNYDPFAGRSEAERIEWLIFSLSAGTPSSAIASRRRGSPRLLSPATDVACAAAATAPPARAPRFRPSRRAT